MKNNHVEVTKTDMNEIANKLGYSDIRELEDTLTAMRSQPVNEIDPEDLAEMKDIKIDSSLPVQERIISLLQQTKNPYCYRYGGMIVKVSFAGKGTIEECLTACFFSD